MSTLVIVSEKLAKSTSIPITPFNTSPSYTDLLIVITLLPVVLSS